MAEEKKEKTYYWLRLDRNFFKRHDIRIIENMENGKDYVLFYMKLLLESIDHVGYLRFNELIPYDDSMLATVTNTNIDIVRSAVKLFQRLNLMEMLDDQTIYMTEINKMLGEAKSTDRVHRFRDKQKQLAIETVRNVTETESETELEIEKEIELDIKKDKKHKFGEFEHVRLKESESSRLVTELGQDIFNKCIKRLDEYIQETGKKYKDHNLTIRRWVIDAVKSPNKAPNKIDGQQPKSTNKFNQYPQREYTATDYAELEKKLINKGF